MEPVLPYNSFALFKRVEYVKRGDIVLVDHPDAGILVRRVAAISRIGRVSLARFSRSAPGTRKLDNVDPDRVLGRLTMAMRWGRFLPTLRKPPQGDPQPDQQAGKDADET
ncbi:MAG: S24/S26 family peptidase [Erythrobacter sp.]|jgi:hypothetical protein|nr:S24/S26 family peptidase [Erythrobacter sp.]